MTIKGPIERPEWTQIRVSQFTFNIVIKWCWKACMTPFLSLPPAYTALANNISHPPPPPHLSAPAMQTVLTTPLEAITEIKVQVTLPRGWHFWIGSDSNNSEYRYQVMQRDR